VIEFRKYNPLPKLTTPLTEGVTPDGQNMDMSVVTAEVKQYGGFIELSDVLMLAAIDNNLVQATKLLGGQAGRTLDTITREVLAGGTNVQFAEGQVTSREELVGGKESENHYLTVDAVRRGVRFLKKMNAETINGSYVGIIHPDVAYDLMSDPKWVNVKSYSDPEGIYQGEIGKIENVRFVESTEAKIFKSAGSGSRDVYSTLIIGENAYGTTEISGGGLEHIVKQLGSAGAADPLNQRGSAGWKATKAAVRLVEPYMVRIETTASV
jgi:N4-gp56 family major capsid protein